MNLTKRRYAKGHYIVRDDVEYADALRDFIVNEIFRRHDTQVVPISPGRKRTGLYSFHFAPANKTLIMKVARLHGEYPLTRRVELYLRGLFRDYSYTAYCGAIAVEQAGIPTPRALAYWTYRRSLADCVSYFLYEKVNAECTIRAFRDSLELPVSLEARERINVLCQRMADIVRTLHSKGLRHGDIHSANCLMTTACLDSSISLNDKSARVFLIDTDHVVKARISQPLIKRFLDLRCLRTLDFDEQGRLFFLKDYLGSQYSYGWWLVLRFWVRGGFRVVRWRKANRWRGDQVSPREV